MKNEDMDKSTPLVSVIIPVYNRGYLVGKTIDSVLDQDYPNIEIIVVDDCSNDNSKDVIAEYGNKVVYYRHDKNMGAPAARNTGIMHSSGQFVAFLDSDDIWKPGKISAQVKCISSSTPQTALVYTGMLKIDESGNIVGRKIPKFRGRIFKDLLRDNVIGSTSVPLIRRDVVIEVGGFDESLPARQDLDLWLRIARSWDVDYVSDTLVLYSIHGKRISSNTGNRIQGYLMVLDKYYDDLGKYPSILSSCYEQVGWLYKNQGDYRKAREYFFKSLKRFPCFKSAYHLFDLYLFGFGRK